MCVAVFLPSPFRMSESCINLAFSAAPVPAQHLVIPAHSPQFTQASGSDQQAS
jgi:hypothetical protein